MKQKTKMEYLINDELESSSSDDKSDNELTMNNLLKFKTVFFFLSGFFFHERSQIIGQQGKGEGFYLTPLYHFHLLHRHLDIGSTITAEGSPLHITTGLELETFGFRAQVANH